MFTFISSLENRTRASLPPVAKVGLDRQKCFYSRIGGHIKANLRGTAGMSLDQVVAEVDLIDTIFVVVLQHPVSTKIAAGHEVTSSYNI